MSMGEELGLRSGDEVESVDSITGERTLNVLVEKSHIESIQSHINASRARIATLEAALAQLAEVLDGFGYSHTATAVRELISNGEKV